MMGAREGQRGGSQTDRSNVVAVGIGILRHRQVTPRWEYDPVQRHIGGGGVGEGRGCPPCKEIIKRE